LNSGPSPPPSSSTLSTVTVGLPETYPVPSVYVTSAL
jgi:hypothetical protein